MEAKIRVNGQLLNDGQAMTIRVALSDFYSRMGSEGLGADEKGVQMADLYRKQSASVLCLLTSRESKD